MLLALPGSAGQLFDRRWLLLYGVQVYFFVVGISLRPTLTALDHARSLLHALTFALAMSGGSAAPDLAEHSIPDLVPRSQLRAATRLEGVSINLARFCRAGAGRMSDRRLLAWRPCSR